MPIRPLARMLSLALLLGALPARAAWVVDGNPICVVQGQQIASRGCVDPHGGALITWQDRRGATGYDIYVQKISSAGLLAPGWPANGVAACTAAADQTDPAICGDDAGGAIVVWVDRRTSSAGDIYAQHITASGANAPGWPAGGVALCLATDAQTHPVLVSDGTGGAIVVWQDRRDGINDHLIATRVGGDGATAPGWSADGDAIAVALGDATRAQIASDGAGGAFLAWLDDRNGPFSPHVYAQHVTGAGTFADGWEIGGLPVCVAPESQYDVRIAADGAGGAIVTWADLRAGVITGADVYAQRVADPATVSWTASGVPVCTISGDQTAPAIATDGAGGAIVAWSDRRPGASTDIYAQHLDAGGTRKWSAGGVPVCTATNSQASPVAVEDGAGGAVFAWLDLRDAFTPDDPYDVYAQRLDSAGARAGGWPLNGITLCAAPEIQRGATIVSDHAGGAIVTWDDSRSGPEYDVYAQRVTAAGAVGPTVDVPREPPLGRMRLLPPSPNPTRGATTIRFEIREPGPVTVEVLDLAGRVVRTVARERAFTTGGHVLAWDGRDDAGVSAPSGLYLVRLSTSVWQEAGRIALLK